MPDYRTPEEDRAAIAQEARIRQVLDQAVTDGASLLVAMEMGEPQDVMELWTDRLWNGLRAGLVDGRPAPADCPNLLPEDDRIAAIVRLLEPTIQAKAKDILRGVADA